MPPLPGLSSACRIACRDCALSGTIRALLDDGAMQARLRENARGMQAAAGATRAAEAILGTTLAAKPAGPR